MLDIQVQLAIRRCEAVNLARRDNVRAAMTHEQLALQTVAATLPRLLSVRSAIIHTPLALMLRDSLMVHSTDFRTGDNENASIINAQEWRTRHAELNNGLSPETVKCMFERRTLVSATRRPHS